MFMKFTLTLTWTSLLIVCIAISQVNGACNVCNANNGIACISETEYQICSNGVPDSSITLTCPDNKVCTDLKVRCVDSPAAPLCNSSGCGRCSANKLFTCTSRTNFVQCQNGEPTQNGGTCPQGYVCRSSEEGGQICVRECSLTGDLECTNTTPL